jgi:hypothetical protein
LNSIFSIFIILPPAVANVANNSKWGKSKIENTGVHAFGRLFAQLLCGFGTDGALRKWPGISGKKHEDYK